MLPQLGLAYIFRGQDEGLGKSQEGFLAGFQKMGAAVGDVVDRLTSMGSTSKMVLQEKLELDAANAAKAMQSLTIGWSGGLEKDKDKMIALSQELKMPALEVAKTYQALDKAGTGIDASKFLRYAKVHGVASVELANSLGYLVKNKGFKPADIEHMMETLAATDKGSNMGSTGLQNLSKMIDDIKNSTAGLTLSAEDIRKRIEGRESLGALLSDYVGGPEAGVGEAGNLEKMLLSSQGAIEQLRTGLGTQIPESLKELSIFQGDSAAAFETMKKNPKEYVKEILKVASTMKDGSIFQLRFAQDLQKTAPGFASIIGNAEKSREALKKLEEQEASAAKNMKTMASDANKLLVRTDFKDIIEYEGDLFMKQLSKMAPHVSENLTHSIKKELHGFTTLLKEADPNSFLGKLGKGLATVRKEGPLAFLPAELKGTVGAISAIKEQLKPTLSMLGEMGISFENLFSPSGWLKFITGGVVMEFFTNLKKTGGDVTKAFDMTGNTIDRWINKAISFFEGANDGFNKFLGEHSVVIDRLKTSLQRFWDKDMVPMGERAFDKLVDLGIKAVGRLFKKMAETAADNPWMMTGMALSAVAGGLLGFSLFGLPGVLPGMKIGELGYLGTAGLIKWFNSRSSKEEEARHEALDKDMGGKSLTDLIKMRDSAYNAAQEGEKAQRVQRMMEGNSVDDDETPEEIKERQIKAGAWDTYGIIEKKINEDLQRSFEDIKGRIKSTIADKEEYKGLTVSEKDSYNQSARQVQIALKQFKESTDAEKKNEALQVLESQIKAFEQLKEIAHQHLEATKQGNEQRKHVVKAVAGSAGPGPAAKSTVIASVVAPAH